MLTNSAFTNAFARFLAESCPPSTCFLAAQVCVSWCTAVATRRDLLVCAYVSDTFQERLQRQYTATYRPIIRALHKPHPDEGGCRCRVRLYASPIVEVIVSRVHGSVFNIKPRRLYIRKFDPITRVYIHLSISVTSREIKRYLIKHKYLTDGNVYRLHVMTPSMHLRCRGMTLNDTLNLSDFQLMREECGRWMKTSSLQHPIALILRDIKPVMAYMASPSFNVSEALPWLIDGLTSASREGRAEWYWPSEEGSTDTPFQWIDD
jgi:hypothetical protein